ncbi:hypothetical protein [Cryptosporangium phraense]|uniref:hypothetical protein n=1 Tax=Cryptosporangium phraense TaxID=2593070 RepID=UPI003B846291
MSSSASTVRAWLTPSRSSSSTNGGAPSGATSAANRWRYDGDAVAWRQAITKPIRLNLQFDVRVAGDTMTGHSRAGRLPRSTVTGRRRA